MSVSIEIDGVVKKFGKDTVINGVSLNIAPGEFFTLLGPSGCGKTTLLRMIIGFNSIEGGTIKVDGRVINDVPINRRNMGMVFQNYAIFPHMSVWDNVAFGLKMRNLGNREIMDQVEAILKVVKIDHLKDRMPAQLSGGQQQRVALARAIVIKPQVLLMDEPLSNLDAKLRVEMRNAIKQLHDQVGITTVYVTHDQEEALAISDKIAIMNGGVIEQINTPQRIYRRPASVFVATFIGLSNLLDAVVTSGGVEFSGGYSLAMDNLAAKTAGQAAIVSVRPEEFTIVTPAGGDGLKGVIESSVFLGLATHYFVRLTSGQLVEVIDLQDGGVILSNGTPVTLTADAAKINVFAAADKRTMIRGEAL